MKDCPKCKKPMMLMSGHIFITPDSEPYESGIEEESKTGVTDVEKHIDVDYCEYCDKIVNINEK